MKYVKELIDYIEKSPTAFHAADNCRKQLEKAGYKQLDEKLTWDIVPGGKYYVMRNKSAIIAVQIPKRGVGPFKIVASHSDSPCFKIKENAELTVADKYVKLNAEAYGSAILSSWMDRPLSVAGRIVFEGKDGVIEERLVDFARDLLVIPNLAIHLNRQVNEGYNFNKQKDMLPLFCSTKYKGCFHEKVAELVDSTPEKVLGSELYVYNRMKGSIWGAENEYVSAPRLDDLACAFLSLTAFLGAKSSDNINVYALFDNEEEGSLTKQGADSTLLADTLKRIVMKLSGNEEDYYMAVAGGMMVSADNAHAAHPNHFEKADENNNSFMNEGVVIKYNASQKYTTDAVAGGFFKKFCRLAKVPYQFNMNRSDMAGGSTLGRLSNAHVSIWMTDIGLAQLAMHSSYETMGVKDAEYMVKALTCFYSKDLKISGDI